MLNSKNNGTENFHTEDGTPAPSTAANSIANAYYGYTISGSNPAECTCSLNLSTDNMSIKPGW